MRPDDECKNKKGNAMNRPIEDSDYSDLKQQVEALRKRIGEMESKAARSRRVRNRALPVLIVTTGILLTFGALGAAECGTLNALFVSKSGNVGIRNSDPKATLDVAGTLNVSGESTLKGKVRVSGGNVGIGDVNPEFPLSFAQGLGDKISLFVYTGKDAAQKDINYHYGFGIQPKLLQIYTPQKDEDIAFGYGRSASFKTTMRITGSGDVGIGSTTPKARLDVRGEIRGKPWFSAEYEWKKDQGPVTMTRVDRSVCFLTMIAGGFNGLSELAQITENGDRWMLGGKASNSAVRVKARCIGAPDGEWVTP
jgi:hypothetical protein